MTATSKFLQSYLANALVLNYRGLQPLAIAAQSQPRSRDLIESTIFIEDAADGTWRSRRRYAVVGSQVAKVWMRHVEMWTRLVSWERVAVL